MTATTATEGAPKLIISVDKLRLVIPSLNQVRGTAIADLINKVCPAYGIDTVEVMREFIATCAVESWDFTHKSENLNYSADALRKTWPTRFQTIIMAQRYERQPEKIANYVYGGRQGNVNEGDGWRFRGAGFIQMTFRDMFNWYGQRNKFTAEDIADKMRSDDFWAMDSACFVFAIAKNLVPVANSHNFLKVSQLINGAQNPNGMEERLKYYDRASKYII